MEDLIPKNIREVYEKLEKENFEVYFVGGCVRNLLMKLPVKDWDLTTNATPEQILKLFPNGFYNNQFGTVGVPTDLSAKALASVEASAKEGIPVEGEGIVEITTFRTEHGFSDRRHPNKVKWGKTIEEDLGRRDFTINAIALSIVNHQSPIIKFIDPFKGQEDIENKIIRAVGNPAARFKEDALRLLRAIRFATVLEFNIEEKTGQEIVADAGYLSKDNVKYQTS